MVVSMGRPEGPSQPAMQPALQRAAASLQPRPWLVAHLAGALALAIGAIGFVAIAFTQDPLWSTPDPQRSLPVLVAAGIAAAVSLARREGAVWVPLIGVGLAAGALVLGWFLLSLVVIAATAAVILILSQVM
jgi:hypothetical protein